MKGRKNILGIIKRQGYEYAVPDFNMTPELKKKFYDYVRNTGYKIPKSPFAYIMGAKLLNRKSNEFYRSLYDFELKPDTNFDEYGVALEAGSEACKHLRRYYHPLQKATTLEEINAFPFPEFSDKTPFYNKIFAKICKALGKAVIGGMQCTIWESAWYVRSMESLMMDMLCEPELANAVLDKVTKNSCNKAISYARGGADIIYLGDDIGMQSTIMMSEELYVEFIKPRLKKVIDSARAINPNIIFFYHTCGYVEPFIPHLIEVGVDVLNPVQPECMDFKEIFEKYGDKLSFTGTVGTQTLMPFGTTQEIKDYVKETLDFVGPKGGLIICPTHILEPEVPVENVIAYLDAIKEYKVKK